MTKKLEDLLNLTTAQEIVKEDRTVDKVNKNEIAEQKKLDVVAELDKISPHPW